MRIPYQPVSHHFLACIATLILTSGWFSKHLIERCLLLQMDRDQCIKALADHASIRPVITLTVWRELLKENRDFFQTYLHSISSRPFISGYVRKSPRFARRKQWK